MTSKQKAERKAKLNDDYNWLSNRGYDVRKIRGGFELYNISGFLKERHTMTTSEIWPS